MLDSMNNNYDINITLKSHFWRKNNVAMDVKTFPVNL